MGKMTASEAREWLESLDDLRYSKPQEVHDQLMERVVDVPKPLAALWHGVLGSCERHLRRYHSALSTLAHGLGHADAIPDHSAAGALYQRISMIRRDQGEYRRALENNDCAIGRYWIAEDEPGISRCLVDRGTILYDLGRSKEAERHYLKAKETLPSDANKSLAAVCHSLAVLATERGDIETAARELEAASGYATDPFNSAKLTWAAANALSRLGTRERAESLYGNSIEMLYEFDPVDCGLATVDYLQHLLSCGKGAEAHAVAAAAVELIGPLRHHKLAQAVAVELVNHGRRGQGLDLAALASLRKRMEKAAASL